MAPNSTRAVIRMNGAFLFDQNDQGGAGREANTIYYLMTHTPHEKDFSCFGPFHCREAFVPSLLQKLHEASPAGLKAVLEILESPGGLDSFERVIAPLPNGKNMRVYLYKEENALVKRALPCTVWHVLRSEALDRTRPDQQDSLDICGTFTSAEAANQRAKDVIKESARESGGRSVEQIRNGLVVGCVLVANKMTMVETRFESGEIVG